MTCHPRYVINIVDISTSLCKILTNIPFCNQGVAPRGGSTQRLEKIWPTWKKMLANPHGTLGWNQVRSPSICVERAFKKNKLQNTPQIGTQNTENPPH